MMARTNKMWIAKKKAQQAKQKNLLKDSTYNYEVDVKKSYTNPKNNSYTRFFRSGKYICHETTKREDPDGFRILRKPNWGEVDYEYKWLSSWGFRKWLKKCRRNKLR